MLSTFEWMNNLAVSAAIRESVWMSPLVNVAHLVALVMFVGAVLIVDLKLVGNDEGTPVAASPAAPSRGSCGASSCCS